MFKRCACLLLIFGLSGCFSTFVVGTFDPDSPAGIPFFAKVGRMKQTTIRTRTWMQVTLSVAYESSVGIRSKPRTATIAVAEHDLTIQAVTKALVEANAAANRAGLAISVEGLPSAVDRALAEFVKGVPTLDGITQIAASELMPLTSGSPIVERLAANDIALVAEADYSRRFCFNVCAPVFGTGSGSLEIAPDGTLSKATAAVSAEKFADVLPVKDLISKQFSLAADTVETKATEPKDHYVVTVDARPDGYKFTLTSRYDIGATWKVDDLQKAALTFADAQSVVRGALNAAPADDDGDKFQFSGSVAVPKG
jgi:hypothetical protein